MPGRSDRGFEPGVGFVARRAGCFDIQKALMLDGVDKHQAVEHKRCISLAASSLFQLLNQLQERGVFSFEPLGELSGDPFHIEGLCYASHHVDHLQARPPGAPVSEPAVRPTGPGDID